MICLDQFSHLNHISIAVTSDFTVGISKNKVQLLLQEGEIETFLAWSRRYLKILILMFGQILQSRPSQGLFGILSYIYIDSLEPFLILSQSFGYCISWASFYNKVLLLLHIDSWLLLFLSQYKQIDEIANKVQLVLPPYKRMQEY